jgi:hypothetical protein
MDANRDLINQHILWSFPRGRDMTKPKQLPQEAVVLGYTEGNGFVLLKVLGPKYGAGSHEDFALQWFDVDDIDVIKVVGLGRMPLVQ